MTTTLITDGFGDDEDLTEDDLEAAIDGYRREHNKQMTRVAKVLHQARISKEISKRMN